MDRKRKRKTLRKRAADRPFGRRLDHDPTDGLARLLPLVRRDHTDECRLFARIARVLPASLLPQGRHVFLDRLGAARPVEPADEHHPPHFGPRRGVHETRTLVHAARWVPALHLPPADRLRNEDECRGHAPMAEKRHQRIQQTRLFQRWQFGVCCPVQQEHRLREPRGAQAYLDDPLRTDQRPENGVCPHPAHHD